jgi:hypothetical protein
MKILERLLGQPEQEQTTDIQKIFQASKINGAPYYGDLLPAQQWNWPKETGFQRRRRELRREAQNEFKD